MNALQIGTLLIVFAGAFGAVNHNIFRLPSAIGILIVAFVASLCVLGMDALHPGLGVAEEMRRFVADAELSRTLLEGMLGLLQAKLPKSLQAKIIGEPLFNDGVGYVVFLVLVGLAFQPSKTHALRMSAA